MRAKTTYILLLFVFCVLGILKAQTITENYKLSTSFQVATQDGITDENGAALSENDLQTSIVYFDGLGRSLQTVNVNSSPNNKDIITHFQYNSFGQQVKEYLPFPSNQSNGNIISNAESETTMYYSSNFSQDFSQNIVNPYSESELEKSSLNRVLKKAAPGKDWALGSGNEIKFDYSSNDTLEVKLFKAIFSIPSNTETPTLINQGYYQPNQLSKTITFDENHTVGSKDHSVEEFKDKEGKVLLKRTYENEVPHDTYYVYDKFGNLTYVLPPLASDEQVISQSVLNTLCYQYKYDKKNRLIEKKIPGKDWEYIIYNKLDQPIMTQDALLRTDRKWLFTKYDAFGNVVYTGLFISKPGNNTRIIQQSAADNTHFHYETKTTVSNNIGNSRIYYTSRAYPQIFEETYTITYYDNYMFDDFGLTTPSKAFGVPFSNNTKSLVTGSKVRVLGTGTWIKTLNFYDDKSRLIYTATHNEFKSLKDHTILELDFSGKVLRTENLHNSEVLQHQINLQDNFTYDHIGRSKIHSQKSNILEYDELLGTAAEFNVLNKTTNESWTNSDITSKNYIENNGFLSFSLLNTSDRIAIGLTDYNNGPGLSSIQYAFYLHNGVINIYESDGANNSSLVFQSNNALNGSYEPGDSFRILSYKDEIFYYKNNTLLYRSKKLNDNKLYLDASIFNQGGKIINTQLYNHTEELISQNEYDEIGQLVQKNVGNEIGNALQNVDFKYNVRGWLTNINDVEKTNSDLFSFKLNYNITDNTTTPLYNGNISKVFWKTKSFTNNIFTYSYEYDALNRITEANFDGAGWLGRYAVGEILYDKNGNILNLARNGQVIGNPDNSSTSHFGLMDNLSYTYNANQLVAVNDTGSTEGFNDGNTTGNDYNYDSNGNMLSDANKGITSVLYNHLNMPTKITVAGTNAGVLDYKYSADGIKLQMKKTQGGNVTTTDYANDFVYENNILKQFYHPEGYVEPDGTGYQYVYQLKDIWGNTRITFADDNDNGSVNSSEIRREQNFYPFGLEHRGYNSNSYGVKNNLKTYQGQEFTEDLGLNTHEWKYRISDPALGRFWQIDPLAEDYVYNSTYAFQENKMGMGIELEGLELYKFPVDGSGIARAVESGINYINNSVVDAGKSIGSFFGGISDYLGDGAGGFNFTSKNAGGGDPGKKGGRDVQSVDADGFIQAGGQAKGGTSGAPLNKTESFKDVVNMVKTVNSGLKKGSKTTEAIMDATKSNDTTVTAPFASGVEQTSGSAVLHRTKDSTVTINKNNVSDFNRASQKSIQNQEQKVDKILNENQKKSQ